MLKIMQLVVCDAAWKLRFHSVCTPDVQARHGVHHVLGVNDVIAIEHRSRFVP
jgi:hypothetical protein